MANETDTGAEADAEGASPPHLSSSSIPDASLHEEVNVHGKTESPRPGTHDENPRIATADAFFAAQISQLTALKAARAQSLHGFGVMLRRMEQSEGLLLQTLVEYRDFQITLKHRADAAEEARKARVSRARGLLGEDRFFTVKGQIAVFNLLEEDEGFLGRYLDLRDEAGFREYYLRDQLKEMKIDIKGFFVTDK